MIFLIILATSILTAIFSFWTFRSERWWELKVKTYTNIMESLHYVKKYNDNDYDKYLESKYFFTDDTDNIAFREGQLETKESMDALKKRRDEALQEIEKTIDTSSFIIEQNALNELIKLRDEYRRGLGNDEDVDVYIENIKNVIDTCAANVRIICSESNLM